MKKIHDREKIPNEEFTKLLQKLIGEAKVTNCDKLAREIGLDGRDIRSYLNYDKPEPCSPEDQHLILFMLGVRMIDSKWKLADKYADYRECFEKIIEWSPDFKDYYDSVHNIALGHTASDISKLHDNISENFKKMTKFEKDFILKYFFSVHFSPDEVVLINYVYYMPPELLSEKWNMISERIGIDFDLSILDYEFLEDEFPEDKWILDNAGAYMNLAFRSGSPDTFEVEKPKDGKLLSEKLEKLLKHTPYDTWEIFEEMAPVFLKMTRAKWFFLAQCKFLELSGQSSFLSDLLNLPKGLLYGDN